MKTILQKIGRLFERVSGFIGGLTLALLIIFATSTCLRLMSWKIGNIGLVYAVLFLALPIFGSKFSDIFASFFAPIFNLLANFGEGAEGHMGPDTHDRVKDLLMEVAYVLSIILLIVSALFSTKTLLFISIALLVMFIIYAVTNRENTDK